MRIRFLAAACMAVAIIAGAGLARAASDRDELEQMKKDIQELRRERAKETPIQIASPVDQVLCDKYGPNAPVTTKQGKLEIGGLVQVWYTTFQKDNRGLFDGPNIAGGANPVLDRNKAQDINSFRVRRTEIKLTMEINENVSSVVVIDPSREETSAPYISDNQINQGVFKRLNQITPFDASDDGGNILGSTGSVTGITGGAGGVPRMLKDAYINYHGVVPHHDFQVGQFKAWLGEDGLRSAAQLDFVERSFNGTLTDGRDLGASVHGSWWDDRFQYWIGAFNAPGNYYTSGGQWQNRSDDNNSKDFNYRVLVRPLWKEETWGSMELGMSSKMGRHGNNQLGRPENWAIWHDGWFYYAPGGSVKGLWTRAEYTWMRDRNVTGTVLDPTNTDTGLQGRPEPFSTQSLMASIGYKFSESIWNDCNCSSWWTPLEVAFRYDSMQNVQVANPTLPYRTAVYWTRVYTPGLTYYIKGHNAKLQLNYNFVRNPTGDHSTANGQFHNVHNDSLVVNFQVAF